VICGLDFEFWPDKKECVSDAEFRFTQDANLQGTIDILIGLLFPVALEACVGVRLARLVQNIQGLIEVGSASTDAEAAFEFWKNQLGTCGSTTAGAFRAFLDSLDIPIRAQVFCMAEFEGERQRKYQSLDEDTSKRGKGCCKVKTKQLPRQIPITI